jgi:succinyl-diaminopimelate desuccinylase
MRRIFDAGAGAAGYDLAIKVSGESFLVRPGPLSNLVADAVADVLGQKPEFSTTGGISDARFIKDACPVCEFGMVGMTMHKADERCALADLEALTKIYHRVLERYFRLAP